MRKGSILCTVMLVLLAACGGEGAGSEQEMLDARSKYLSMAGCTAQVELTADYGERIFPCTVVLDHTAGGETTLTLLEPELLRGVTARVRAGELTLEFDGMAVEAGPLLPEGLSPLDCLPFVLEQMKTGYLSQWGYETVGERECLRLTASNPEKEPGEGVETTLWLLRPGYELLRAEVSVEGRMALRCECTEFEWKENKRETKDGTDTNEDLGGDRPEGTGA